MYLSFTAETTPTIPAICSIFYKRYLDSFCLSNTFLFAFLRLHLLCYHRLTATSLDGGLSPDAVTVVTM